MGYELDITALAESEIEKMKEDIKFFKEYRELIQFGKFIRLESPFKGNTCAWMVISQNKKNSYFSIL